MFHKADRLFKGAALLGIFLFILFTPLPNINAQGNEYYVKAAYLEKFSRFTEWPSGSLSNEFVITIIGRDPFKGALEEIALKYKFKNLPVRITHINEISELKKCNMLFIGELKKGNVSEITSAIKYKPVLLIGETKGYCEKGVHINFYLTDKGTIHFEINPAAIKRSGLKIDMYLLGVGKVIGE